MSISWCVWLQNAMTRRHPNFRIVPEKFCGVNGLVKGIPVVEGRFRKIPDLRSLNSFVVGLMKFLACKMDGKGLNVFTTNLFQWHMWIILRRIYSTWELINWIFIPEPDNPASATTLLNFLDVNWPSHGSCGCGCVLCWGVEGFVVDVLKYRKWGTAIHLVFSKNQPPKEPYSIEFPASVFLTLSENKNVWNRYSRVDSIRASNCKFTFTQSNAPSMDWWVCRGRGPRSKVQATAIRPRGSGFRL